MCTTSFVVTLFSLRNVMLYRWQNDVNASSNYSTSPDQNNSRILCLSSSKARRPTICPTLYNTLRMSWCLWQLASLDHVFFRVARATLALFWSQPKEVTVSHRRDSLSNLQSSQWTNWFILTVLLGSESVLWWQSWFCSSICRKLGGGISLSLSLSLMETVPWMKRP